VGATPEVVTVGSTPESGSAAAPPSAQDAVGELLHLIGRPPLKPFLRFARHHALKPASEGALVEAWRAAREHVHRLAQTEAGLADQPPIGKLPPDYEPLLLEFLKDPLVRNGFNTVPTEVAMVELDRLVVYQEHIDVSFARQLEQRLGPAPSDATLFRICLPFDHPQPPVEWSRVTSNKFVFVSRSNDLRFLGPMALQPDQIRRYPPPGNLVGIVGIPVGFGSNFMNAIAAERRLILHNGSHRAYALRRMGVTRVPCIVQHVASRDELEVVAGAAQLRRDLDLYLTHPRPPMLKDYFNPHLHMVMPVRRRLRQVTIRFEVEEDYVPAL
jgi:hypothetical protein